MRKLPIYLLVDTSDSQRGEPIVLMRNKIQMLVFALHKDPQALETACLSIITFGGAAEQILPLTELAKFDLPELRVGGERMLGAALDLLCDCRDREVAKTTAERKGDWKPYVFIFTNGDSRDLLGAALGRFYSRRWSKIVSFASCSKVNLVKL